MSKEIRARIERASYQTHLDTTEIVVSIPGDHTFTRGEIVTVTVKEAGK